MSSLAPQLRLPTRRNTELLLIIFAVALVACAEGAVDAALDGKLSSRLLTYAAVPLLIGVVVHLIIRRVAPYADPLLLPIVVLLNGLGLVMIHRIDLGFAKQASENHETFSGAQAPTQVLWTAIGVALFIIVILVVRDHRVLQRYAYTLAFIGLAVLILPAVLPARFSEVNGARIWIRLAGFSFQPSECAKILLTIFAAAYLVQKRDVLSLAGRKIMGLEIPRGRDFGPLLVVWIICIAVLVRGRDLGTSLLFFGLFVAMLYMATERVSWVIAGLALFLAGCYAAYRLFGTVQLRVEVWLHAFQILPHAPANYPCTPAYTYCAGGYQLREAMFGLGTGGIFGTGLGAGHPEITPLPTTDFIVGSFGEELGLFGGVALLVLYALLIMRALATGLLTRDAFGKLLASGLAFMLAFQLFVVVGGVTRLLPETGLTTPFLSYGGSSLLGNWVALALLVRISNAARRPPTTPNPTTTAELGAPIRA